MTNTFKSALTTSVKAAVDLVKQRAIGFDGNYAAAGGQMYGVSQADTKAGEQTPIDVVGELILQSGGAFAVGGAVEVGANGKVVAQTTGVIVGYAIDAAAGADEFPRILVK